MLDFLLPYYAWIKALHIVSVISWMAGMFYLPRLFVYHAERTTVGSDQDKLFQEMEQKLLRLIINPAMIVTWLAGLIMLLMGAFDFGAFWSWIKIVAVLAMSGFHGWLSARRKDFTAGKNTRSGRTYRLANEVPTVLMLIIVIAVVVRPF